MFKTMPNINLTLKKLPKTFNIMPMWQNFAKSGHTDGISQQSPNLPKGSFTLLRFLPASAADSCFFAGR